MSQLIKPITSDHDLIELAERLNVHLDDIFESREITKPLPKKGTYLILLRQPIPDFGASLPKKFKSSSMRDIPDLDIKSLFRMIVLSPLFSGKNNLCMYILKHSPRLHSYFATEKMIRLNAEYVAILKANSKRDLVMVVNNFNIPQLNERNIMVAYNKATERKGQMLFIDSVKGQIRYNFDRPIVIDN
ncbi:unnamed protein product [Phytophthora lilii]|uniref:Unnamed protein product n=1 Tax=Phytophthora lilii TaxID=2077276 RepID=A0A9W7D9L2_9STRA|nr:unnamed protein product [Phytophthora lilii]